MVCVFLDNMLHSYNPKGNWLFLVLVWCSPTYCQLNFVNSSSSSYNPKGTSLMFSNLFSVKFVNSSSSSSSYC